ncbi:MAG: hypothetical protein H7Y06_02265 [Opitutaceae bacterium]|nr:hypothetical protein [Opitutaceae bacterium]
MKFKSTLIASLVLAASAALNAAPLAETTPVFGSPDTAAKPVASLPAGTEPALAPGVSAPAGWTAVTLAGPHEVWAPNSSVNKALEVRAGASYFTEAKTDAPVLATAQKDDPTDIIDYKGKWTKFRLSKPVTGYIKSPAKVASATPAATSAVVASAPVKDSAAPVTPGQQVGYGRPAPVGDGASSALPRLFQGKLASTQSPLRPRRPYDFQLTDDSGARYAYVDVSKLLATEQINKYTDRTVVVYGTAKAVPGTKDMVIIAESLQLR